LAADRLGLNGRAAAPPARTPKQTGVVGRRPTPLSLQECGRAQRDAA
jgi:hypothetical protein